ncbi:YIEGIA family protein [Thermosyntropha sp.]|uniref:YIEGIA family protein n=1 Tax=Thermosyntropha sp. TaxID=2740820 RepID=UPI0025D21B60|nr:YIEGIA family protein [Thermosyntropha sp.]MBO8159556.1 YIEGIA domain-containing protein [Thermosyntropha sp.]
MDKYGEVIFMGVLAGFLSRLLTLRSDYRHYPAFPHGYFTHLALGFIASCLGAVAVPAIAKPDYTAVTFLVLAAQQFREIRNMERETMTRLEETKLVRRGTDYIEGIARVFEARNYLAILTALITSGAAHLLGWQYAILTGIVSIYLSIRLMRGAYIGDIAEVEDADLHFEGSLLMVEDVVIMNVGLPDTRQKILEEGIGVLIKPKDDNARLTLHNPGQRMAIIHDVVSILGTKVDINETEVIPMARKHVDKGYLAFFVLPNEPDREILKQVIRNVPLIETAQGTALKSFYGRKAAD